MGKRDSSPATRRERVGLVRRLAAAVYDSLLLGAVLFAATALLLPLTKGEAVVSGSWWYNGYLLLVGYLYFGWFWTHGGQTLGMKAWRFQLVSDTAASVSWLSALVRYLGAIFSWTCVGVGFLWAWVDREGLAWHDRLSATRLLRQAPSRPPAAAATAPDPGTPD